MRLRRNHGVTLVHGDGNFFKPGRSFLWKYMWNHLSGWTQQNPKLHLQLQMTEIPHQQEEGSSASRITSIDY